MAQPGSALAWGARGYVYYNKEKKWKWRIIGRDKKQKGGNGLLNNNNAEYNLGTLFKNNNNIEQNNININPNSLYVE